MKACKLFSFGPVALCPAGLALAEKSKKLLRQGGEAVKKRNYDQAVAN